MFPSTPWLELVPGFADHSATWLHRLLAFFDAAPFRLLGYVVLVPLLLSHLGLAAFGVLALSAALFGVLGVAQRGLALETSRRARAAHHVGDWGRLRALLSAALALLAALGGAGGLAVALLCPWLPTWLGIEPRLAAACTTFLYIEAARFAFAMPLGAVEAGVQGAGRAQDVSAVRGALTLAQFAIGLAVVAAGFGLVALGVLSLVATLAAGALHTVALYRAMPRLGLPMLRVDTKIAKDLASASLLGAGQAAAFLVVCDVGTLVVAVAVGIEAVAVFAIAAAGTRLLALLALSASRSFVPAFTGLGAQAQRLRSRWVFRRAMDAAFITASACALLVAAFGARIVTAWLGTRGLPTGLMPAFGLLMLTSAPVAVGTQYLVRAGLQSRLTVTAVAQLLVSVLLALTLLAPLGLPGVVWAMILAQLATTAWLAPHHALNHLAIVPWRFWRSRAWRLALVTAPSGLAAFLFSRLKPAHSTRELILQTGITLILHLVTAFAAWYLLESRPELDVD